MNFFAENVYFDYDLLIFLFKQNLRKGKVFFSEIRRCNRFVGFLFFLLEWDKPLIEKNH